MLRLGLSTGRRVLRTKLSRMPARSKSPVPKDVCCKRTNKRGKKAAVEGMFARPELDNLARCQSTCNQTPDVSGGHDYEEYGSGHCDRKKEVHCRYVPGRCHSQRPVSRAARTKTKSVQSFSSNLRHMT